jgi:predicted DNA-binding transcriptional regulator YafY
VATLLFLQSRGRATVAEVAAELEVSERTARRDLEALSLAGVPVYAQRGRGGGWSLVGGARTDLTGLTADEIRALFLLTGPAAGATPATRTVLRKLVRALPAPQRAAAEAAARAGVADPADWAGAPAGPAEPHLATLQRAVVDGVRVRLGYATPGKPPGVRTVDPLGLAAKAGASYLVAGTGRGLRMFRLDRVTSAEPTGEPVTRPADFDLATAWRAAAARIEDRLHAATVTARAEPGALRLLARLFGARLRTDPEGAEPGPDGRVPVTIDGPSPEAVAGQLAGLGARVEVVAPPAARARLAAIAAELAALYGGPPAAA